MNTVSAYKKSEMKHALTHPITLAIFHLIEGICFYKDQLEIRESIEGDERDHLSITITPHMADYSVLCGKDGRQIRALRFLVNRAGKNFGIKTSVSLEESYVGEKEPSRPFKWNSAFDEAYAVSTLAWFGGIIWPHYMDMGTCIERESEKIHIYIEPASAEDVTLITALADIFYPFGFRNGMKIEIHKGKPKSKNSNSENPKLRQSEIPGGKRERAG